MNYFTVQINREPNSKIEYNILLPDEHFKKCVNPENTTQYVRALSGRNWNLKSTVVSNSLNVHP